MSVNISGYFTVWNEPSKDDYDNAVMSITSSHKNKKTDEYVKDYADNFAKFSGDCAKKAFKLKDRDRIYVERGTVSTGWNKETKKNWIRTTIWDYKMADEMTTNNGKNGNSVDDPYDGEINEDDLLPV
jgi:hypothetical protein